MTGTRAEIRLPTNELRDDLPFYTKTLGMRLDMISNRGVKVWPEGHAETSCTDHWRPAPLRRPTPHPRGSS